MNGKLFEGFGILSPPKSDLPNIYTASLVRELEADESEPETVDDITIERIKGMVAEG